MDELVVGVDVETAGWEEGDTRSSMHKGRFGFLTRCREDVFEQRIVQIAWAIGNSDAHTAPTKYKELTIKPQGFTITDKAIKFHGITNECAQEGVSLRDALVEFMDDMHTRSATRLSRRNSPFGIRRRHDCQGIG